MDFNPYSVSMQARYPQADITSNFNKNAGYHPGVQPVDESQFRYDLLDVQGFGVSMGYDAGTVQNPPNFAVGTMHFPEFNQGLEYPRVRGPARCSGDITGMDLTKVGLPYGHQDTETWALAALARTTRRSPLFCSLSVWEMKEAKGSVRASCIGYCHGSRREAELWERDVVDGERLGGDRRGKARRDR